MGLSDVTRLSFLDRLRNPDDRSVWSAFHERYGQLLYRYARARGATHVDAEDVVQEVEMQLFRSIGGFEYDTQRGRFRAYLRAAVIYSLGRRANRQARQPTAVDPLDLRIIASGHETELDEQWSREWRAQQIRWAVKCVSDDFKPTTMSAFELHVLNGHSVLETAETLNISKWRVYRARDKVLQRVREKLRELESEDVG